jgi:predicted membrane protein
MYYAVFALSGGIACTWALYRPSIYFLQDRHPNSKVLEHKLTAGISFFTIATVVAPFMPICLFYQEAFIDSFITNLLKIDSKNTS